MMLRSTRRRSGLARCAAALLLISGAVGLTGCSSAKSARRAGRPSEGRGVDRLVRITYLQKQGAQQYFVDQAAGAKAEAAKLGNVEVTVVDVGSDSEKALAAMDAAIASKVDGMAIVVPDQQIGPQVVEKARAAGIPLIASDDLIKDSAGRAAPFVGFDGTLMGRKVGEHAGKLFKAVGWKAADTAIVASWKQDLSSCTNRVDGALAAFTDASGLTIPVIEIGTDNTVSSARAKAREVIPRQPRVKHWIVWGCNDENTTGVVSALEDSGVATSDIIGVGVNADLSCRVWRSGRKSGNKASLFIAGQDIGANAIDMLVDNIRHGIDLPAKRIGSSTIVDAETWRSAGVPCR